MKLSVTTYPWGKLETQAQFQKICKTIRDIGFEGIGIEFDLLPEQLKEQPKLVSPILEEAGLENGGTYSPVKQRELDWAAASGTPLLWTSIYEKDPAAALKGLDEYAKKCAKLRVICALHNELGSSIQTQPEIIRALDSTDELKLCLDTAHGVGAGVDLIRMIEMYRSRLALVHLKDLRAKLPMAEINFERDFVNVGHGIVDLESVVKKLMEVRYSGQLMLEIEALAGGNPDTVAREGYEFVRKLL
jgi:sugar phosphate isomerase/epimerase